MRQGQTQKRTYYEFVAGYHVIVGGLLFLSHWFAIPPFLSSLLFVVYPIGIMVLGALYQPTGRPVQWVGDLIMMVVLFGFAIGSTFILTSDMRSIFAITFMLLGGWFLIRSILLGYD